MVDFVFDLLATRLHLGMLHFIILIMIRNIVRSQLYRYAPRGVYRSGVKQPLWIGGNAVKSSGWGSSVVMRPQYAFCSNQKKPEDDPDKK